MTRKQLMMPVGELGMLIDEFVVEHGGYFNFHAHIDRSGTIDEEYLEHYGISPLEAASVPLRVKQNITGELHKGKAYQDSVNLKERMSVYLDEMIQCGVKRVISFIDATSDIGFSAINAAIFLRSAYAGKIDFQIAAHPIFGFRFPERWDTFEQACWSPEVSIVGALPERDGKDRHPENIGSDEHIRRVLHLGKELGKEVHIHVGQDNDPDQKQIFDLIEAVRWLGSPKIPGKDTTVWAVHVISSSAYDEKLFRKVLDGLREHNIGVVCCPRAALSMRQLRSKKAPIHNSIARILEMAVCDIPIRLGTDNIADLYVPTGTGSMLNEALILADAIRFYNPRVLAKFAAGVPLNESDKEVIRRHLLEDYKALKAVRPNFKFCIPLE